MEIPISLFTWGRLSALLIAISAAPYAWGIYRGTVPRPVVSSWGLWSLLGLLLLLTYRDAGASMETSLPAAVLGFTNPTIVLLLSLRYGTWQWTKLDTWCAVLCIITVIMWKIFDFIVLSLALAILADMIAAIPQLRKTWTAPQDEPVFPWLLFGVGSAVNLLALKEWTLGECLYPLYMFTASFFGLTLPLILDRLKRLRSSNVRPQYR